MVNEDFHSTLFDSSHYLAAPEGQIRCIIRIPFITYETMKLACPLGSLK